MLRSQRLLASVENGLINDVKRSTIWKIADGLDIPPDKLIKELSDSLGENFSLCDLK